jgi:arginyl-tRNA synthetase
MDAAGVAAALEVPPDAALGDYAFPASSWPNRCARHRHDRDQLAGAMAARRFLDRVESVKGYLNFYIDRAVYAREVLARAAAEPAYGGGAEGRARRLHRLFLINIAKRFHIGHLSTTMIGNSWPGSTASGAIPWWASTTSATGAPSSAKWCVPTKSGATGRPSRRAAWTKW